VSLFEATFSKRLSCKVISKSTGAQRVTNTCKTCSYTTTTAFQLKKTQEPTLGLIGRENLRVKSVRNKFLNKCFQQMFSTKFFNKCFRNKFLRNKFLKKCFQQMFSKKFFQQMFSQKISRTNVFKKVFNKCFRKKILAQRVL